MTQTHMQPMTQTHTQPIHRFLLVSGYHVENDLHGNERLYKPGDVFETTAELDAQFNRPNSTKFRRLRPDELSAGERYDLDSRRPAPGPAEVAAVLGQFTPEQLQALGLRRVEDVGAAVPSANKPPARQAGVRLEDMSVAQLLEHAAEEEIDVRRLGNNPKKEDLLGLIAKAPPGGTGKARPAGK